MNATVNVGMILTIIPGDLVDNTPWMLSGRGVIQIDKRKSIDGLVEDRKIRAILLRERISQHDRTFTLKGLRATRMGGAAVCVFRSGCYNVLANRRFRTDFSK
jgi:hypothetical protein